MKVKQLAVSLLSRTKTGREVISNQRYRMVLAAAVSFTFNLLYALYHCVLGIINLSLWFIAMCAFYGILATMQFSAVLCGRRNNFESSINTEYFVMKLSGVLLTVLSFVLAAVIYISLSQNIAAKYNEIIMITIATYTFCKIILAITKSVKQRKNPSPLPAVIRSIGYAQAAASILTLQRSMLVSFGAMETEKINRMNAITGAVVILFVLILGVTMTIKGIRKDSTLWPNQSL